MPELSVDNHVLKERNHEAVAAQAKLREIFDPLCRAVADASEAENINEELIERVKKLPLHLLPSDEALTALPWDAFLDAPVPSGRLPQEKDEYDEFLKSEDFYPYVEAAENFLRRRGGEWKPYPDSISSYKTHPQEGKPEQSAKDLGRYFAWLIAGEPGFDAQIWKNYEELLSNFPEEEREAIGIAQLIRKTNLGMKDHQRRELNDIFPDRTKLKRSSSIMHIENDFLPSTFMLKNSVIPVGEYGEVFASKIMRTTALVEAAAAKTLPKYSGEATEGNEDVLEQYTARPHDDATGKKANTSSTENTVYEGIITIGQCIALLTQEKVDGYDDPVILTKDLLASGLIERLARYAPMGFIGPMTLAGSYFENSLIKTDEGLKFGPKMEEYLHDAHKAYVATRVARIAANDSDTISFGLQRACPVADLGGGITVLCQAYSALLDRA